MDGGGCYRGQVRMRSLAVALLLLTGLLGCGARSGLESSDDALVDAGRTPPTIDAQMHGVFWFVLATGALRFVGLALCPDGRAVVRTALSGWGTDTDGPVFGSVRPGPARLTAVVDFDATRVPSGLAEMNVSYDPDRDVLIWREGPEVFAGATDGEGTRIPVHVIPPEFTIGCD